MTIEQAYERVNAVTLAGPIPALTFVEAEKAVRKMYRHLKGREFPYPCKETSGNRITWLWQRVFVINPEKGWFDLIHLFSHWYHQHETLGKPHSKQHARLERRLRKLALDRRWLDGVLKDKPKPVVLVTPEDIRAAKIERRRAQVTRLERKVKALTTRLRNARRSLQALERHASRKDMVS